MKSVKLGIIWWTIKKKSAVFLPWNEK